MLNWKILSATVMQYNYKSTRVWPQIESYSYHSSLLHSVMAMASCSFSYCIHSSVVYKGNKLHVRTELTIFFWVSNKSKI